MMKTARIALREAGRLAGLMPLILAAGINPAQIHYVDVAKEAGLNQKIACGPGPTIYIIETVCSGAAFLDYDNDGLLDIYLVNGSQLDDYPGTEYDGGPKGPLVPRNLLYRNLGTGRFQDVTERAGVGDTGWGHGVTWGDYDNDGDNDIYVSNWGPNRLYRNNGDGTFTDVAPEAGVVDDEWGTSASFADYDNDGDLDLFVTNYIYFDPKITPLPGENPNCRYMGVDVMCGPRGLDPSVDHLYRNEGNGKFTDVTEAAGLHTDKGAFGIGVVFGDIDLDGDLDLYVANDSVPNFLYRNNGDGTFTDIGYRSGVSFNEEGREQAGMGVDLGDYDNDGDSDLFVTNFSQDTNTLYENVGKGRFFDKTYLLNLGSDSLRRLGWGTQFFDPDNDGFLDLFVSNGHVYTQIDELGVGTTYLQKNQLFRNLGGRRFEQISDQAGPGLQSELSSRGAAFGDYDNDGDIDIVLINVNTTPNLLRNDTKNENSWIQFRLEGTRSNRNGFGAKIRLQAGEKKLYSEVEAASSALSQNDSRVHFGLGPGVKTVDRVEIEWLGGTRQVLTGLEANQLHIIKEPAQSAAK
jgi:hypothetical protein